MSKRFTVTIEEDEFGEFILPIPDEVCEELGWEIGDELEYEILDDETSNNMPLEIIDEAKKSFNERIEKINWENYYSDIPFNQSALSLYKWAPIAEDLKILDRKIVLNSVIFGPVHVNADRHSTKYGDVGASSQKTLQRVETVPNPLDLTR